MENPCGWGADVQRSEPRKNKVASKDPETRSHTLLWDLLSPPQIPLGGRGVMHSWSAHQRQSGTLARPCPSGREPLPQGPP